ncbi:MAG: HD domain-containing protein [Lachnospiraceae bacterium]|nr:HD domain-containing protein [Lachnospiraceae bacterium]
MFELIRTYQLNIMLVLCGACATMVFLLMITRFLEKSRKLIFILMEVVALFLLWFDRLAYVYSGDVSHKGYAMVRLSNFMVFFMTSAVVFGFNLYLSDLLKNEGKCETLPRRMFLIGTMSVVGMLLSVISAFTGLYYYIDDTNVYHRGHGFLIAYIIPILCPIIQYTVIRQYKKSFSKLIYASLVLYIFVPILCGILQIFTYGISIVNMSMVAVSIFLYIFMYLDLNNTVEHAYEIEIQNMQGEQERMRRLFDQTATAFVSAVEKKDEFTKGNALRIAEYARKVAEIAGKSDEECEKVYYAALLHDVGMIGVPDNVIKNDAAPDKWSSDAIRKKPLIGSEILSSITEYPYLSRGAHYSHERYNGTGYPEGLKGEQIPEIARIIAVADAYVTMTTKKRYRDARPGFVAREAFVKGAGEEFDPVYADIMVKIIDSENGGAAPSNTITPDDVIKCREYRENVSAGIAVENSIMRITFDCDMLPDPKNSSSAPSIVLFDSFDARVHDNEKAIKSYQYLEYGEIWFDRYSITTAARKIEEKTIEEETTGEESTGKERTGKRNAEGKSAGNDPGGHYEIIAGRYEDHLRLVMKSAGYEKEVIVALPGSTKSAYIGLTGENCRIRNIHMEHTGENILPGDIPRIVDALSYIDHMESDIKNVQVDRTRSAYTEGVRITDSLRLSFHTMSLPGANLVWHCPYIVIYSSDNGQVGGGNYLEYTMIKLNGENNEIEKEIAENRFSMKKKEEFTGWNDWKMMNGKGMDCEILLERRGNRIVLKTENLGLSIENTTTIKRDVPGVYAALTGDQVALTDIRVEQL